MEAIEKAEKSGERLCTGSNPKSPACARFRAFLDPLEGAMRFADALADDIQGRRKIIPSLNVGFTRDDVPEDNQPTRDVTKITSAIKLDSDSYPDDFHAEWSTDVRYSEGKLTEELTKSHVNVDHYLAPHIQGFGYVDRTSDSFMSIDQRYEVGFGVDWEYFQTGRSGKHTLEGDCSVAGASEIGRGLVRKGKNAVEGYKLMCASGLLATKRREKRPAGNRSRWNNDEMDLTIEALSLPPNSLLIGTLAEPASAELQAAAKQLLGIAFKRLYFHYISHQYSQWEVSTSAAVSYESTQYSIKTTDSLSGDATSVSGAAALNRWSIRQSIRFRPDDQIELRLLWYWKPAFGGRSAQYNDDVREVATFYVEYIGRETMMAWKPKMRFQVDYYDHNNPPTTDELLNGQPSTAVPVTAASRHIVSRLTIGLEF
jgi:hypothetical protein